MFMKRQIIKRTPEEKERILLSVQKLGVVAGCRQFGISKPQFYDWIERYNALGLEGLKDRRGRNTEALVKKLEKENKILKELLAEKELESRMKDELLKKKFGQQKRKGKS